MQNKLFAVRLHHEKRGAGEVGRAGQVDTADGVAVAYLVHCERLFVVRLVIREPSARHRFSDVEILGQNSRQEFGICFRPLDICSEFIIRLDGSKSRVRLFPHAEIGPLHLVIKFVDEREEAFVRFHSVQHAARVIVERVENTLSDETRRADHVEEWLLSRRHGLLHHVVKVSILPGVNFIHDDVVRV